MNNIKNLCFAIEEMIIEKIREVNLKIAKELDNDGQQSNKNIQKE